MQEIYKSNPNDIERKKAEQKKYFQPAFVLTIDMFSVVKPILKPGMLISMWVVSVIADTGTEIPPKKNCQ